MSKDEPKKVLMFEETDGEDRDGRPIDRICYSCPRCLKNNLIPYEAFCPKCGQALEW